MPVQGVATVGVPDYGEEGPLVVLRSTFVRENDLRRLVCRSDLKYVATDIGSADSVDFFLLS